MRPCATAARSAAPIVTETHVAPVPASNGAMDETSPPPPGTATRAPSAPKRKESGPRLETTMQSSCVATGSAGRACEGGAQDVGGLGTELVERPVAMDAHAQVHLGQRARPDVRGHVDEEAELHPVAVGEPDLLEDATWRRGLPGQRLAHLGQLGEEQLNPRPGHQLGDAAPAGGITVERAGVEALHQGEVVEEHER